MLTQVNQPQDKNLSFDKKIFFGGTIPLHLVISLDLMTRDTVVDSKWLFFFNTSTCTNKILSSLTSVYKFDKRGVLKVLRKVVKLFKLTKYIKFI